jgi:hypothetical protein
MLKLVVSQHGVLVMPVVAYLEDVSVLEELRAAPHEVARIFDHPLEAVLDPELARDQEGLVPHGSEDWPYEPELYVHHFHSSSLAFSLFFSLSLLLLLSLAHFFLLACLKCYSKWQ